MLTEKEIVDILLNERAMMRSENKVIETRLQRVVFLFLSAVSAFLVLHMKGEVVLEITQTSWLLFILTQLAFFLFILAVSYWACLTVYIGYIRSLENKVNVLCSQPLIVWEIKVAHRFTATPRGAFFWAWAIIDVSLVLILLGLMGFFLYLHWSIMVLLLFVFEAFISIGLFIWAMRGMDIAERYAMELIASSEEN